MVAELNIAMIMPFLQKFHLAYISISYMYNNKLVMFFKKNKFVSIRNNKNKFVHNAADFARHPKFYFSISNFNL